jgi:hypothetical protein
MDAIPERRGGFVRRGVLVLLVSGVAVGGFLAGRASVDPTGGATYLTLTKDATRGADVVAVSMAGQAVRLRPRQYESRELTAEERAGIGALLRHQRDWSSAYALGGSLPEPRWTLTIGGANRREIALDAPLSNPALPEALLRLVVMLDRLRYDTAAFAPLVPSTATITLWPALDAESAAAIAPPSWLDLSTAATPGGQQVVLSGLSAAERDRLAASVASADGGSVIRLADGRLMRLTMSVDWDTWAGGER